MAGEKMKREKMWTMFDLAISVLVIAALSIAGCGDKRPVSTAAGSEETPGSKISGGHTVKVSPPFSLDLDYTPAVADEAVPVKVNITPTQDLEQIEVGWTLPQGARIITGEARKTIGREKARKGEKTSFEVKLQPGEGEPQQAVIMVRVMWNGKWYGTAKSVDLKPRKANEPAYKIAPGEPGTSGYIEIPMEPVR